MELWVRGQNKGSLVKANELSIQSMVSGYFIFNGDTCLGEYDTKERCIEILDEIQKLIINGDNTLITIENDIDKDAYEEMLEQLKKNHISVLSCAKNAKVTPLSSIIVYQMPEK